jgi:hypothetical protein
MSDHVVVCLHGDHTWDCRGATLDLWPGATAFLPPYDINSPPDIFKLFPVGGYEFAMQTGDRVVCGSWQAFPDKTPWRPGMKCVTAFSYVNTDYFHYKSDMFQILTAPAHGHPWRTEFYKTFARSRAGSVYEGDFWDPNYYPFKWAWPEGMSEDFDISTPEKLAAWYAVDTALFGSPFFGFAPPHIRMGVQQVYPHKDNGHSYSDIHRRLMYSITIGSGQSRYYDVAFTDPNFGLENGYPQGHLPASISHVGGSVTAVDVERGRLYSTVSTGFVVGDVIASSYGGSCTILNPIGKTDTSSSRGDLIRNIGSYGPGLEGYCRFQTESSNGPGTCGIFARIADNNRTWNNFDIRASMRQSAWVYRHNNGFRTDKEGFGLFNPELSDVMVLDDLLPFGPVSVWINTFCDPMVAVQWYDFAITKFKHTVFALFTSAPSAGTLLSEADKVWRVRAPRTQYGWDIGSFAIHGLLPGSYWLACYTEDTEGHISLLQANEIFHFIIANTRLFFDLSQNVVRLRAGREKDIVRVSAMERLKRAEKMNISASSSVPSKIKKVGV